MKLTARVRANRANARRSTGPKTLGGKSAASRNALRHGLAIPVTVDPSLADEVERLARMIAGEVANSSRTRTRPTCRRGANRSVARASRAISATRRRPSARETAERFGTHPRRQANDGSCRRQASRTVGRIR